MGATDPLQFDVLQFAYDVKRAARAAGISLRQLSLQTGVTENALYRMHRTAPTTPSFIALCAWAGLRSTDYLIDN